jgi:hypothetical protein
VARGIERIDSNIDCLVERPAVFSCKHVEPVECSHFQLNLNTNETATRPLGKFNDITHISSFHRVHDLLKQYHYEYFLTIHTIEGLFEVF